ncbi:hypothetical protein CC80DRAFT_555797 [Byssothecium circinans]|uniref:Uncharacterized protein n=1 Tax=Byssothecium circinans TaxID=147558 RepID=A0A6A5TB87_9PLEO|nr:hypothetical protein CC80DRAFT_555797 [Byssothecium circinans]
MGGSMDDFVEFVTVKRKSTVKSEKELTTALAAIADFPRHVANLRNLTTSQRLELLDGPQVSIHVGYTQLCENVPKRMLMTVSQTAHTYFTANPTAKTLPLPAMRAKEAAMKNMIRGTTTAKFAGDVVQNVPTGNSFDSVIDTYIAGLALGMEAHIKPLKARINKAISVNYGLITYEQLTAIVTALPRYDAVYKHAAHNLAFTKFKNKIPDIEDFEQWLKNYPQFAKTVGEYHDEHVAEHQAKKEERRQKAIEESKARMKQERKEDGPKLKALRAKLNQSGNVILTAEERELKKKYKLKSVNDTESLWIPFGHA